VRFVFPRLREELLQRRIHAVDMNFRLRVTSEQAEGVEASPLCRTPRRGGRHAV
jgi:hypothetical protein